MTSHPCPIHRLKAGALAALMLCASLAAAQQPSYKRSLPPERSGEEVVRAQCSTCHATGKNGAPRIGDREAWIPRLANGLDVLVRSAISGHGNMPARGGMANLTDRELRDAIVYMYTPAAAPAK